MYHWGMINQYENKAFKAYKQKIKLNAPLKGFPAGHRLEIDTDKDGVALSRYWRDRIKDAEIDGCIELIIETKRSKK
tara:strand:- start:1569 stop:1799 length:231 start_codon:yes stop_codon:yes gene_type:complete